jgi:hypothetical protein
LPSLEICTREASPSKTLPGAGLPARTVLPARVITDRPATVVVVVVLVVVPVSVGGGEGGGGGGGPQATASTAEAPTRPSTILVGCRTSGSLQLNGERAGEPDTESPRESVRLGSSDPPADFRIDSATMLLATNGRSRTSWPKRR